MVYAIRDTGLVRRPCWRWMSCWSRSWSSGCKADYLDTFWWGWGSRWLWFWNADWWFWFWESKLWFDWSSVTMKVIIINSQSKESKLQSWCFFKKTVRCAVLVIWCSQEVSMTIWFGEILIITRWSTNCFKIKRLPKHSPDKPELSSN